MDGAGWSQLGCRFVILGVLLHNAGVLQRGNPHPSSRTLDKSKKHDS